MLLALGAAGCGGGGEGYPESARQDFLRTCESQLPADDRKAACACVLEEVERTVPYEQYKQAEVALRQETELDRSTALKLREAVTGCLNAGS